MQSNGLARQPWLQEFLGSRGFERNGSESFTNGRATLRFEGHQLVASPADHGRAWRSDFSGIEPKSVCFVLSQILAAPGFLSQSEVEVVAARRRAAEGALQKVTDFIRENPDTHSGQHLRRFVWSLFNGHHAINLWRLKDVLDSQNNTWVNEVFAAWMQGFVSEEALRRSLTESGEMDRWDSIRLATPEQRRLVDAKDAVTDLLNSIPPGRTVSHLTQANGLLEKLLDLFREAGREGPDERSGLA